MYGTFDAQEVRAKLRGVSEVWVWMDGASDKIRANKADILRAIEALPKSWILDIGENKEYATIRRA